MRDLRVAHPDIGKAHLQSGQQPQVGRADLDRPAERLGRDALVVGSVERHDMGDADRDREEQAKHDRRRLAPFARPAHSRQRLGCDRLLLFLLRLLRLLLRLALRHRGLLALDLVHVEVVVAHRDVLLGGLGRDLLALLRHRGGGRGLGLAPDLIGLALAALLFLGVALLFLFLAARLFLLAALLLFLALALLGRLLRLLLGLLARAPLGFRLRLALGFFLGLALFLVLVGEAVEVGEQ